jgi:hypothetical protein
MPLAFRELFEVTGEVFESSRLKELLITRTARRIDLWRNSRWTSNDITRIYLVCN